MNDRELLEMAAKAAGVSAYWSTDGTIQARPLFVVSVIGATGAMPYEEEWNPLKIDGDALRLAVELGISFGVGAESKRMRVVWFIGCELHSMDMPANHHIALPPPSEVEWVRRAIVRAAAEIGAAAQKGQA